MGEEVSADRVLRAMDASAAIGPTLGDLEKQAVVCTFTKATHKLSIIEQLLPEFNSKKSVGYFPLPLRVSEVQHLTLHENHPCEERTRLLKHVQQDCNFLRNVLEDTIQEILHQGTCHYLQFVICCDNMNIYDEIVLRQESKSVKETVQQMKEKILEVGTNYKEFDDCFSNGIDPCLERAALNAWVQSECMLRYTDVKVAARVSQVDYGLKEQEHTVQKNFQEMSTELDEEDKISGEIEHFIELSISNLREELQKWTERYKEEMDTLDIDLLQIKNKVDSQREKYKELLDVYNERKVEVDEMQADAEERDRQMKLRLGRIRAAIVIQSWWRSMIWKRYIKKLKARKLSLKESKKIT